MNAVMKSNHILLLWSKPLYTGPGTVRAAYCAKQNENISLVQKTKNQNKNEVVCNKSGWMQCKPFVDAGY
eukprot:COSAG02_NODE_14550_length_1260_cov_1.654608_1_plen_69_part_10